MTIGHSLIVVSHVSWYLMQRFIIIINKIMMIITIIIITLWY